MVAERQVLLLEGGSMTTQKVRDHEELIAARFGELAQAGLCDVGDRARTQASDQVAERIGARLSDEQAQALRVVTGPERAAVVIGPAGTGKGVVIDAAARSEQLRGCETLGIAVSGSTAQRLGRDSPALLDRTLTLDALVARVDSGRLEVDEDTTIYFDEAGMVDTSRLERLTDMVQRTGAKLVAIGDGAQLPSIGAGGMFDRLAKIAPCAELSTVHRTRDPDERRAWADLRAGRTDKAIAHYLATGRLHVSDSRDEAVEQAVKDWARLTETHPISEVALISDASNKEIARLNARAQHYRAERGELGELEVDVPGMHYGIRAGDRVAMIDQHYTPGQERIENGSLGQALEVSDSGEVLIEFDVTAQRRTLVGEDLSRVRLGYAQHIHRAQGATVTRTLVVTGGWQTSKEPAYVEASRAREGTDWYVNRKELGTEGHDTDRIERFAENMRRSRRQTPSLEHRELPDPGADLDLGHDRGPDRFPRVNGDDSLSAPARDRPVGKGQP
jgi:ATP-dependent exoDNAse (exonuclease V) alpha subunit